MNLLWWVVDGKIERVDSREFRIFREPQVKGWEEHNPTTILRHTHLRQPSTSSNRVPYHKSLISIRLLLALSFTPTSSYLNSASSSL